MWTKPLVDIILLHLPWDFRWKWNGTVLFCVGFCSFCCGFSRIHSCGYQVSRPLNGTCQHFQTTNWSLEDRVCWKSNIRKTGEFGVLGFEATKILWKAMLVLSRAPHPLWIQLQHFVNELRISLRHIALSSREKLTKLMRKISWDSNWIGASQILSPTDSTTNDWHWHSIPCQQKTLSLGCQMHQIITRLGQFFCDHRTSGSPLSFRRRSIPMVIPLHFLLKQRWMVFPSFQCFQKCFGMGIFQGIKVQTTGVPME